ncbi:MAG: glycosyltransferase [Nitrospinota bacterium]|nr:glycosyltransferase [Nitrospinota bacterium]
MKISVVTISFNQAKYLEEAILSVITQSHPDMEYIVVDPGSTDGSRKIIEKYRDRITKVIYEPDDGPADGLNHGFANAAGVIYGFLNSDDVLEPGAISTMAQYFHTKPELDVISGHSWIIDEKGKFERRIYSHCFSIWMAAYGASRLVQPSTFFRKAAFAGVGGFNRDNRVAWDAELYLDMALAGARFAVVPEFISRRRIYKETITGGDNYPGQLSDFKRRLYEKATGKKPDLLYPYCEYLAWVFSKIRNPSETYERIRKGPSVPNMA